MKRQSSIVAVLLAVLVSGTAFAQGQGQAGSLNDSTPQTRQSGLSIMAYLPWLYGFGIGLNGRYTIPVAPNGFVPSLNDEFDVEPSIAFGYRSWGFLGLGYGVVDITPAVYGIWDLHFSPKLDGYIGLGLGYDIAIFTGEFAGTGSASFFYWDPVIGMHYNFSKSIAFRAELGAESLKAGLTFYF